MLIPLLASRKLATSTRLYTGGDATVDVATGVDVSNGVMMFGRRDTDTMTGWVFGDDATEAIRFGGPAANWDSAVYQSLSGLTIGARGFTATTAFAWNDSSYSAEDYVVWSVGGDKADIVTWTGTGSGVSPVSHSLGVTPGAMLVSESSGGVPVARHLFWESRFAHTLTPGSWTDHGTTQASFSTSTVSPATGETFDTASRQYKAVLFPASSSNVVCGSCAALTIENIGWQPRTLIWAPTNGTLRSWDGTRDGATADNSSDLSTNLYGSTSFGVNSAGDFTLSSVGFTMDYEAYYIAIR